LTSDQNVAAFFHAGYASLQSTYEYRCFPTDGSSMNSSMVLLYVSGDFIVRLPKSGIAARGLAVFFESTRGTIAASRSANHIY
jgi:hypothetical protein